MLSSCFLYGVGGCAADAGIALLLAQESASLNNANGAVRLGYLLQYGRGTGRDLLAAAKFYKMAADRGHAEGLYVSPVHLCIFVTLWEVPLGCRYAGR